MHDELEQETGLDTMTKAELKAEARARGLSTTGTKAELLARVEQHDSEPGGDGDATSQDTADREDRRARQNGADDGEAHESEPEPGPSAEDEQTDEEPEPEPAAEDEQTDEARGEPEPPAAEHRRDGDRPAAALTDVAAGAARSLTELTGRKVDAVSGVRTSDDGYVVTVEVLELSRVPSTTDVLATYEVQAGRDGAVTGYSRIHRYYRNQTTRD